MEHDFAFIFVYSMSMGSADTLFHSSIIGESVTMPTSWV